MKKKLLIASCLVLVGLFVGMRSEHAEAQGSTPPITSRASVNKIKFFLPSGNKRIFSINSFVRKTFGSKIIIKVKPTNPNNDYFLVEQAGKYSSDIIERDFNLTNQNSEITYKISPLNDEKYKDIEINGQEQISVENFGLYGMNFEIGMTSSVHMKSIPCIDYSDIDFDL